MRRDKDHDAHGLTSELEPSLVGCIALANNDVSTEEMDLQVMKEQKNEIVAAHSSFMKDERKPFACRKVEKDEGIEPCPD